MDLVSWALGTALGVIIVCFGYWLYGQWDFRAYIKKCRKENKEDFIRQCKARGLDWKEYWSDY